MGFRSLHRNLKIRMVDSFLSMILGNMLFPFMTIYFAQQFGGKTAGVLLMLNVALGVVANFCGGYLADRYGRRTLMLVGESIRFTAFLGMMVANSPWFTSPLLTFVTFTITGLCWGLSGPAMDAMMVDVSTPENRKLVYSVQYWSVNFSLMIGGVVGGFFFQSYRFELFVAVCAAQMISLLLLVFFIEETHRGTHAQTQQKQKQGAVREMLGNYKLVFADRRFMVYVLASLLMMSVEFMNNSYTGVRLADEFGTQHLLGLPIDGVKMFGMLGSENSLFVVLLTAFVSVWIKKRREQPLLILGVLLYAVGYAMQAWSNQPLLLFLCMGVAVCGELIWVPIKQSLMADLAPEENRSAYMAVNGLVFRGASILGSLAVTIGAFLPSWTMAILFLLSGLAALNLLLRVLNNRTATRRVQSPITTQSQTKEGIA
ncbi:MFS transporter [Tumebacillus sp. ITR2]|uniref:MFS transporter n=1 Tax=Tumebacillus amylolyticus TaxID=2801339 RepID=A0ABS1J868_9BACL|nr:MFS transporter [Tumebacillus amylolyticus]MBL0385843.1 MFS transporter [Tumebacillus amylolyticus]